MSTKTINIKIVYTSDLARIA